MQAIKKLVGFDPSQTTVRTEFVAAVTTFLTMSYILAVNPAILGMTGMDKGALFSATAIVSAIATLLMAVVAKLPFAIAPSMGLNAFFAFTLCQGMGLTWQQALGVLLVEGVLFILITFLRVREIILESIPHNLRFAISAGIGMFIAFVGLRNTGLIAASPDTLVKLGEFTPTSLLGVFSILLCAVLYVRKVKGALFYGIFVSALVGIPFGVTQLPEGWTPVSTPHSLAPTFWQFDFSGFFSFKTVIVLFSLLLVNIFDTVGTLITLIYKVGLADDPQGVGRMKRAMLCDAVGTTCSAVLGSSSTTSYVESASGVAEGGRSGLTALFVAGFFLLSLFLAPVFLLIPLAATSGPLVMVGVLMMDAFKHIDLDNVSESFAVFITVVMMVLCGSIADGIGLGLLAYVVVKICTGRFDQLNLTLYILALLFILNYAFG